MPVSSPHRTTRPTSGDSPADRRLLRRYAATHDPGTRDQLAERYLPLARFAANRYQRSATEFDDLLQVASVGLLKAIDRFDPGRGVTFAGYALPTMFGELRRHLRDLGWAVRPPRDLHDSALRVDRTETELTNRLGRSPSVGELADACDLDPEAIVEARCALAGRQATPLSTPVAHEDATELGDLMGTDDADYERVELRTLAETLLGHLPKRERQIIQLRFGEDLTQKEIGERLGLSQMHVSRVLRDSLAKLHELVRTQPDPLG